jgi:mRNA-degrading endonuclease toxin of MazEF toxin-antitoxin module
MRPNRSAVSVDRLGARIGEVTHAVMEDIDEALRLHLAL